MENKTKNIKLIITGLLFSVISVAGAVYLYGWSIDDPWIAYRYAENLAHGNGLVFNIGERLESYTSLTIILILSVFIKLGIDPDIPCRMLGIFSTALIPLTMIIFFNRIFPGQPLVIAVIGTLLYAINPAAALWSVGGLETNLHALILLMIFFLFLEEEKRESENNALKFRFSFLLMFILALNRIEAPIIFAAACAFAFKKYIFYKKKPSKQFLTGAAVYIILYLIYTLWRINYFGNLLPNTFYAKATGGLKYQIKSGLKYTLAFLKMNGHIIYLIPVMLFPAVAFNLMFGRKNLFSQNENYSSPENEEIRCEADFLNLFTCIVFFNLFFIVYCGGDWMPLSRFFVHFIPLIFLGVQFFYYYQWKYQIRKLSSGILKSFSYGIIVLIFISGLFFQYKYNYNDVYQIKDRSKSGTYHQQYFEVGKYLKENADKNAYVAGSEAGIIPYISGLRFIDIVGLVDAHIARKDGTIHAKSDPDYVLSRKPEYLVLHTTFDSATGKWRGIYPTDHEILNHKDFENMYVPVKSIIRGDDKWGKNLMVIFKRKND